MRAEVQYNDFLGTSAADISDHRSLDDILREKGVDTDQYKCIGIEVYSGYADYFHVSFLCRDNSTRQGVKISFEKEISRKDFFNMFVTFFRNINLVSLFIDPIIALAFFRGLTSQQGRNVVNL